MACVHGEKNLSQLHAELQAPLPKLHYHVERLIAAKVLRVSRSEKRAGRAIRYFRAVADRFWVPQEFLHELPGDARAAELREALRRENGKAGEISLLYAPDPQGRITVRLVRDEDAGPPRTIELWWWLHLDPEQRAALGKEMAELLQRYGKLKPGEGTRTYLAHAAFAPVD